MDLESDDFGDYLSMIIKNPKKDFKDAYVAILAADYTYNIHWN